MCCEKKPASFVFQNKEFEVTVCPHQGRGPNLLLFVITIVKFIIIYCNYYAFIIIFLFHSERVIAACDRKCESSLVVLSIVNVTKLSVTLAVSCEPFTHKRPDLMD